MRVIKARLTQSKSKFPGESNIVCRGSEGVDKEPRLGCSPYSEACIIVSEGLRFHSWLPLAEVGKTGPIESRFVFVSYDFLCHILRKMSYILQGNASQESLTRSDHSVTIMLRLTIKRQF